MRGRPAAFSPLAPLPTTLPRLFTYGPAAKQVADLAVRRGITYVNHTFTSHLCLSASLQPFAGREAHETCEYPVEATPLAVGLTRTRIERDAAGRVTPPAGPGLGLDVDLATVRKYLVETEIRVGGRLLYRTLEV